MKKLLFTSALAVALASTLGAQQSASDPATGNAIKGAVHVRDLMRDPDSFQVSSVRVTAEKGHVCMEFRSKNGFGGYNNDFAVYKPEKDKAWIHDSYEWEHSCVTGRFTYKARPGTDVTEAVKTALKK